MHIHGGKKGGSDFDQKQAMQCNSMQCAGARVNPPAFVVGKVCSFC